MADLIGFEGHPTTDAPFDLNEYPAMWKNPAFIPWNFTQYRDFDIINERNSSCVLPTFWDQNGTTVPLDASVLSLGCLESDFDQYGDLADPLNPDWRQQLSKYASVQDRLREWKPSVMDKLTHLSCLIITALDFDAIRIDKATQIVVGSLVDWSQGVRRCAQELGKDNFFITGEVLGSDAYDALYYGRGRTTAQRPSNFSSAANMTQDSDYFLRDQDHRALDAAAFHYPMYNALVRFLGVDNNVKSFTPLDIDFASVWEQVFLANDVLNPKTNLVDPRHMFGTSNFDTFRWASLQDGKQKSVLGTFITNLVIPGIPLLYYGEEQNIYLYDSTSSTYLFGRQAMTSTQAWKRHGCYALGSDSYFNMPFGEATKGCQDDWNALDHFDPTADSRRLFRRFNQLRSTYGALRDGFNLTQLGKWTHSIELHDPFNATLETGLWSVLRTMMRGYEALPNMDNDGIWLLYSNTNASTTYSFDCMTERGIFSPYPEVSAVRNLFPPYEAYALLTPLGGSETPFCMPNITLEAYGFKALVPIKRWTPSIPALTKFHPGHDYRILSDELDADMTSLDISFEFDTVMDCDSVTNSLSFSMSSSSISGQPTITNIQCKLVANPDLTNIPGSSTSVWAWSATLHDLPDGVLTVTIDKPSDWTGSSTTQAVDHLLIRKGLRDNVLVFPQNDYSQSGSFQRQSENVYAFIHKAYGADRFRYSWNFGRNWTEWKSWENITIMEADLFTSPDTLWNGAHIMVQYWSEATLSMAHVVHADTDYSGPPRRVPQFLVRGDFNRWGTDGGIQSSMIPNSNGLWELEISSSWPSQVQLNVWAFDDYYYGDVDGDGVLDRLPPDTMASNFLTLPTPPRSHLTWLLLVNDSAMTWSLEARGKSSLSATVYTLLLILPTLTGLLAVATFIAIFYGVRHNQYGISSQGASRGFPKLFRSLQSKKGDSADILEKSICDQDEAIAGQSPIDRKPRRTVLIATLEYEILDWKIKVRIGGLGVMSTLMGKALPGSDLVWIVPKVGDVHYPSGETVDPIKVVIFGEPYLVDVETHAVDNITYILLDSPVFRAQTKADPYPARMDDLSSSVFYSTWNQAIAAIMCRLPQIDIYHINDYHGGLAPLYLLPKVRPVCLSLHNAEFQGLWPLRTQDEIKEVCSAFNITQEICIKYVQFGNTFNLLHAAASYISIHQNSVGVAGVSDKYGKRSLARYPALWILKNIDSLPNPDPDDVAPVTNTMQVNDVKVDEVKEAYRVENKRQAQEWAGLEQDAHSDLFVFVGRWSKQKGIDLIADVIPSINVQLIVVGPVIDLYGRFAAEKFCKLAALYPGRIYSRPEFTSLPPCVFNGADFALIPSRDEPFGLVAVEFGRKGALGIGSRVGGLGSMPGWWYPIESDSISHLLSQFTRTIEKALKSTSQERAILRARSAVQRFPVIEWRQKIDDFHKRSIAASGSTGPAIQGHRLAIECTQADTVHGRVEDHPRPFLGNVTMPNRPFGPHSLVSSMDSISSIVEDKRNSPLNKVATSFTDADGDAYSQFAQQLHDLNPSNSLQELSIGKYLSKSEEAFFGEYKRVKLSRASSMLSSQGSLLWMPSRNSRPSPESLSALDTPTSPSDQTIPADLLVPMSRLQIFLSHEIGSWPIYTIIVALGQLLSATSLQMTLLTGRNWEDSKQIYVITSIFLVASAIWYLLYRLRPSVYALSAPWIFFGISFLLIGLPSLMTTSSSIHRVLSSVASCFYAIASAAAFLFFSLNFGEENGVASEVWTMRACIIQGSQQVWVAVLWYWAYTLNNKDGNVVQPWWIALVVWPLAIMSFAFAYILFYGLPEYYRQTPPRIPYFFRTLMRRKLVPWFFVSEILRNYWLSGSYGRSWSYLWGVDIPKWRVLLLVITFFVFIWVGILSVFMHMSKSHTWLLPVFAVGLGAPRWCQMLWGSSSLAFYLPWAGNAGPYLGVSLWLWLGVLDAVQGVGLGMILLQVLSRFHVCATLAIAQIVGSICVMVARASAPNRLGPGSVFPGAGKWDFSNGVS
ncbi:hypothetical protein H0H93_016019, partial [Arthromyces matolae]